MSDQAQANPNASSSLARNDEEIIVRDADGKFKVLRHGILEDWTTGIARHAPEERLPQPVRPVMPTMPPVTPQPKTVGKIEKEEEKKNAARFYFDVQDEEEIERYRESSGSERSRIVGELAQKKAIEIMDTVGIALDEELKPRLLRAIVSRLKDVRDLIETKEVLLRSRGLGGVNLSNTDANKVLKIVEEYRIRLDEFIEAAKESAKEARTGSNKPGEDDEEGKVHPSSAPSAPAPGSVRLKAYDKGIALGQQAQKVDDATDKDTEKRTSDVQEELPARENGATIAFEIPTSPQPRPYVHPSYVNEESGSKNEEVRVENIDMNKTEAGTPESDNIQKPEREQKIVASPPRTPPDSPFLIQNLSRKPQMTDVRPTTRIMGPIEELRYMSVEDFRRLAQNAMGACDKVREKIDLLADESLLKRNEGLLAWKSSPVHQLYLKIGKESMNRGLGVEQLVQEWQKKNMEILTHAEFEAIADLNERLAY